MKSPLEIITIDSFQNEAETFNEDTLYHGKQLPQVSPTSSSASSSLSSLSLTSFNSSDIRLNDPSTPISPDRPSVTPQPWIWTCHECRRRYPLGVTRRCLYDGHVFCSGQLVEKRAGSKKKQKIKTSLSCNSEFDYISWGIHMEWKKQRFPASSSSSYSNNNNNNSAKSGCWWHCSYPNQCRYRNMRPQDLPPAIDAIHRSLSDLSKGQTGRAKQTFMEEPDSTTIRSGLPHAPPAESAASRDRSGSDNSASGRGRGSLVIERVIRNAEKRAADLHASTTAATTTPTVNEGDEPDSRFMERYIMPVIDFVSFSSSRDDSAG